MCNWSMLKYIMLRHPSWLIAGPSLVERPLARSPLGGVVGLVAICRPQTQRERDMEARGTIHQQETPPVWVRRLICAQTHCHAPCPLGPAHPWWHTLAPICSDCSWQLLPTIRVHTRACSKLTVALLHHTLAVTNKNTHVSVRASSYCCSSLRA